MRGRIFGVGRLLDYGARYYDPRLSRFLSVDPLASEFPGWNPYHYVHNNPLRFTDPTGMSAEDSGMGINNNLVLNNLETDPPSSVATDPPSSGVGLSSLHMLKALNLGTELTSLGLDSRIRGKITFDSGLTLSSTNSSNYFASQGYSGGLTTIVKTGRAFSFNGRFVRGLGRD